MIFIPFFNSKTNPDRRSWNGGYILKRGGYILKTSVLKITKFFLERIVLCSHDQDTTPKKDGPGHATSRSARRRERSPGSSTQRPATMSGGTNAGSEASMEDPRQEANRSGSTARPEEPSMEDQSLCNGSRIFTVNRDGRKAGQEKP